jgi:hypothetical protein
LLDLVDPHVFVLFGLDGEAELLFDGSVHHPTHGMRLPSCGFGQLRKGCAFFAAKQGQNGFELAALACCCILRIVRAFRSPGCIVLPGRSFFVLVVMCSSSFMAALALATTSSPAKARRHAPLFGVLGSALPMNHSRRIQQRISFMNVLLNIEQYPKSVLMVSRHGANLGGIRCLISSAQSLRDHRDNVRNRSAC